MQELNLFWATALGFAWSSSLTFACAAMAVLGGLVFLMLRFERRVLANTFLFFIFCLLGILASGAAFAAGITGAARALREIFVVASGIAVIRLLGLFLFRAIPPRLNYTSPRIVEDIAVLIAYAVWAGIRLHGAGMNLGEIVTASAIVTAVIAFSMQDTLGNILGGLAIELDNSISVGDWIKVDDVVGRVTDIRWRSTSIETRNWETVVIPNSALMKGKFYVLGKRTGMPVQWRRWIYFAVDPAAAPARVIGIAQSAVTDSEIPCVATDPLPNCLLMGFDEGNLHYALRYWLTDLAHDDPTDSLVRQHVFTALQRAGIRMSEPEQTVHMVKEDAKHAETVHAREIERRLRCLKGVDLFAKFHDDELATLAEHLAYAPFSAGDVITRQGNVAHWLYIVISGEVEVVRTMADGVKHKVGVLTTGSLFGEMGLMTGEPRTATGVAKTDVECYRLDKESFANILQARPEVVEDITRVLIARRGGIATLEAEHRAALDPAQQAETPAARSCAGRHPGAAG